MLTYTFDGKSSMLKNDIGEATIHFKKVKENRVDIQVEMKHYPTNTNTTYKKGIEKKENGKLHHYPIQDYAVESINVGEYNTIKKYFSYILGEQGYQEFKGSFLNEFRIRQELELNWFMSRG